MKVYVIFARVKLRFMHKHRLKDSSNSFKD